MNLRLRFTFKAKWPYLTRVTRPQQLIPSNKALFVGLQGKKFLINIKKTLRFFFYTDLRSFKCLRILQSWAHRSHRAAGAASDNHFVFLNPQPLDKIKVHVANYILRSNSGTIELFTCFKIESLIKLRVYEHTFDLVKVKLEDL